MNRASRRQSARHARRQSAQAQRQPSAERREILRHAAIVVSPTDVAMMNRIEKYIIAYSGDDLLHDIELTFPDASFRAFFLAYSRAREAARWFTAEGSA